MTTQLLVLTALNLVLAGVVLLVAVRLVRALRHTVELESRVTRLQEGVNLLSDATETGLRLVMNELERISEIAATPARTRVPGRPTAAGVRAAARRGESVQEIAARERVSEGEVRLRLTLADATATRETRESEGIWGHGRLRAQ